MIDFAELIKEALDAGVPADKAIKPALNKLNLLQQENAVLKDLASTQKELITYLKKDIDRVKDLSTIKVQGSCPNKDCKWCKLTKVDQESALEWVELKKKLIDVFKKAKRP